MKKFRFSTLEKINQLPTTPGIYAFKNREFLYIGKAINIRERVKNHFQQPVYRDGLFLNKVKKIGYIKTNSEIEALILEANLIKKYQPRYNIAWRDNKNYFYVAITKEDFPRVFWTHQIKTQSSKLKTKNHGSKLKTFYLGPFVDGKALKQTLKVLRKIFPFRSCKTLPSRPCLWYQLARCPAPCLLNSKSFQQIPRAKIKMKEECQKNVKNLIKIFQGKKKNVLKDLKKEMEKFSKEENFEKAAHVRDKIFALEKILTHVKIFGTFAPSMSWQEYGNWRKIEKELKKILKTENKISRIEAYDISNIQGQEATGSMVTFISGQPNKNFYRKFKIKIAGKPNDIAMLREVLERRLTHSEWGLPDVILLDGGKAQVNAAIKSKSQNPKTKKIKVIAVAKKRSAVKPRTRFRFSVGENKLFIENEKEPIFLRNLPREIFNLILELRDEAHRFAVNYHRKLRRKKLFSST